MAYKAVKQFQWVLVLGLICVIYLSNLILINLPFISISCQEKELSKGLLAFLASFFPHINFNFQTYNLQTIVVWACGIIAGYRTSLISVCCYILIGFIGFPVFASGGGIDYCKEPTFGYLISLPLVAFLSGYFFEKNKKFHAVLFPIFINHILGITFLLFFKQSYLPIAWNLSFSMIGYDLFFAFLLMPVLPFALFFINELFIQEIPARTTGQTSYEPVSRRFKFKGKK